MILKGRDCLKKVILKAFAVITALTVLVTSFSACSGTDAENDSDKTSFAEMKSDGELAYNTKGEFSVNLSVDNITLDKEMKADNVKVFYSYIDSDKLPDIDASQPVRLNTDEYSSAYAKVTSLTVNSEHSVTVVFSDGQFSGNKPDCFFVLFDNNSNTSGRYLISMIPVKYPSYSLVSDTTQIRSESTTNRFKLTLDKSSFAGDISVDDIVLSGGFENCSISNIEKIGENTLSFTISTDNGYKSGDDGCITVKRRAVTDAAVDVSTTVDIVSPAVQFQSNSFEASTNYARIPVSLIDCSFSDSVAAGMFGCDDDSIEITRFDRVSANEGVLYLSFDADTPSKAISLISDCTFSIKDNALNINYPLYFSVSPKSPDVSAVITKVEENGSDFRVTAQFSVVDGTFNVISKNSFIFSGDYSKAMITSITAQDDMATVSFDIPKTSSPENAELYGTVGIRSGAVMSRWGIQTNISAFPLYYSAAEQAESTPDVTDNDTLLDMLSAMNAYFGSVAIGDKLSPGNIFAGNDKVDYTDLSDKYGNIYATINRTNKLPDSENVSSGAKTAEDIFTVRRYMNDLMAMHALIRPVSESTAKLFAVYDSMSVTDDAQELETLGSEAKELTAKITSVYSANIKGMSYSELLNRIISEYTGGATDSFDALCDNIYNWYPQGTEDKKMFRSMSLSIIINAAVIEYISASGSEDNAADFGSVCRSLAALEEYQETHKVSKGDSGKIFCTTLGRSFSLQRVNSVLHDSVNEITLSEISQLENLMNKDSSMEKELESVGFGVSSVRYIVCADSNITGRSQTEQGRHIYSFVRRATLYDLTVSRTVNEMEYCNYYYSIEIDDDGKPSAVPYVNVYYRLYTLK